MKNLLLATAMWAALMGSSAIAHAESIDQTWVRADENGIFVRTDTGRIVKQDCISFEDASYLCGYFKDYAPDEEWQLDITLPYTSGCFPGGNCIDYIENCPNGMEDVACFDFVTGG